jgi:hypothetical protein
VIFHSIDVRRNKFDRRQPRLEPNRRICSAHEAATCCFAFISGHTRGKTRKAVTIPKVVELACHWLEHEHRPLSPVEKRGAPLPLSSVASDHSLPLAGSGGARSRAISIRISANI